MLNTDINQNPAEIGLPPTKTTENSPLNPGWENAIQQYGQHKDPPSAAIFNAAFISKSSDSQESILLARAINTGESIKKGVPDLNFLMVCAMDHSGNIRRLNDLVLPMENGVINWEDNRVWQSGNQIILGATAIVSDDKLSKPCPAIVVARIKDGNLEAAENPKVFQNLVGKNVVPLEDGFLCRLDGNSHALNKYDFEGNLIKTIDFSKFSHIKWLNKKIGATARPIELADHRKILLIHGIQGYSPGIDGTPKDDIYSLGIAVLDKNWRILAVDPEPILKRSDFLENLKTEFDRDPHKEVIYLCDYQQNGDILTLPVNVGDRITVFTHISFMQLLDRAENILLGQHSSPLFLF